MSREPLLPSKQAKALSTGDNAEFGHVKRPLKLEYGGRKFRHGIASPETYTAPNYDLSGSQRVQKKAPSSHLVPALLRERWLC